MKPTTKQIRKEAKLTYLESWQPELQMAAYEEGAKWALSQDSTLEKVIELRDEYQKDIDSIDNVHPNKWKLILRCEKEKILAVQNAHMQFVSKLNAIIEAK